MKIKNNNNDLNINNSKNYKRTPKSFSFFQNIEYIINNASGSKLVFGNKTIQSSNRAIYHINTILKLNLMTLKSYYKGIQSYINIKYNIPLVISNKIELLGSKGFKQYECIWINNKEIVNISSDLVITFKSGNTIKFNNTFNFYNKQIELINTINNLNIFNNK